MKTKEKFVNNVCYFEIIFNFCSGLFLSLKNLLFSKKNFLSVSLTDMILIVIILLRKEIK